VQAYWRDFGDDELYASIAGDVVHALDPDQQITLGGDNGLRGYPLRYQTGDARLLLTVEQRVFTDWYPLRLTRVGAAAFYDVGRAWGGPEDAARGLAAGRRPRPTYSRRRARHGRPSSTSTSPSRSAAPPTCERAVAGAQPLDVLSVAA
jgi:hypothetical protein